MISIETLEIVGGMFIMLCVAFYVGRGVGYRQHADDVETFGPHCPHCGGNKRHTEELGFVPTVAPVKEPVWYADQVTIGKPNPVFDDSDREFHE